MKTALNLDDRLLHEAMQASGIRQKTAVIHEGLRLIIEQKARERLILLGGKLRKIKAPARR